MVQSFGINDFDHSLFLFSFFWTVQDQPSVAAWAVCMRTVLDKKKDKKEKETCRYNIFF
jgi:hypothetical protein